MSKKLSITIIALAILLLSAVILWQTKITEELEIVVRDCDIAKLQREIEQFPYEGNVGPVPDAETAVAKAIELWQKEYGEINGKSYDPTRGCPISVGYDQEKDCWAVNGTLPPNAMGSVPFAIIQSDGTVLALGMA